ncbi:hypothetical protein [Leptospira santarosai]|uniref:PF09926 repeat protein n=6 Tax=Leptospira santarosai TaxID=28183 RepID=A0AB73LM87_9LEPT|nr:hypothetical protein [Leptospira santarosai]EMO56881.1 hypothetical protein LEP1GSC161_2499 [Leptospira santarosai str. CBC1416]AVV49790.1 Uncharacterized protein XB17_01194 [Leptospira santarosai]MDI7158369.1 hypothetical protein [Leptospira santarosai]MDI7164448.1 hypothetical protein [Leptospira santarosai]MDI7184547.1 hypothetical protein [Leptospira santarosai]
METEEKQSSKRYVIGEAVRDKRSGQKMYVDAAWSMEIKCVYYDVLTNKLVKVEVPHEELEKVEDPFLKTIVRE